MCKCENQKNSCTISFVYSRLILCNEIANVLYNVWEFFKAAGLSRKFFDLEAASYEPARKMGEERGEKSALSLPPALCLGNAGFAAERM